VWPLKPWALPAGALEYAVAYAKERETFRQTHHPTPGIGFKLADMTMRTEAARPVAV